MGRGWERAGELSPIRRYARMFSGTGLKGLDGTAWYHPRRNLILVDRHETYAHNDPASASPKNAFLDRLVPFLTRISRR